MLQHSTPTPELKLNRSETRTGYEGPQIFELGSALEKTLGCLTCGADICTCATCTTETDVVCF